MITRQKMITATVNTNLKNFSIVGYYIIPPTPGIQIGINLYNFC